MLLRPLARTLATLGCLAAVPVAISACGSTPSSLASGDLYDKTFAGKNKCNPKNHTRPFIIDWDATDQSSFQAHAQNDIVFVRYEGCELQVLDGCRDDSVKGAMGSYKPVEWTSGNLETVSIEDQGELFAKLPLGASSLAAKLEGGRKLRMEYYVSGTRSATRDRVFRKDLKRIAACEGATHFVYGFNLGAFALATGSSLKGETSASIFGFGAGGKGSTETKADKRGGELSACKGDSAKEVDSCKVPIRLTLKAISESENPDDAASVGPESDASKNLAGRLKATTDKERKAAQKLDAARTKLTARDGKGCLAELDEHDRLDSRPEGLSTNHASFAASTRALCLMVSGQCAAGKELRRKAAMARGVMTAEQADSVTDLDAGIWCQGAKSERDELLGALTSLHTASSGSTVTADAATCQKYIATVQKLQPRVTPKGPDDWMVQNATLNLQVNGPRCLGKAGDCARAEKLHIEIATLRQPEVAQLPMARQLFRSDFERNTPMCKGK